MDLRDGVAGAVRNGCSRTLNWSVWRIAQVLLGCDSERRWLRRAPARIGHLFPRLPGQSEYNRHLRDAAPALFGAAMWLARHVPTRHERLRLMDGTPLRCGASRTTVHRSGLEEIAGYGHDASHHAFYWGAKLMLITTAEDAVTAFSLAHPKELDERKQALHLLHVQPPAPGPCPIVCDKCFAGAGIEAAASGLGHVLIRPTRHDEPPTNVTLLGDAVHAMTPTLGRGANLAMRDATLLGRALRTVATGDKQLDVALSHYERDMTAYGFSVVREAVQIGEQRMAQNPLPA